MMHLPTEEELKLIKCIEDYRFIPKKMQEGVLKSLELFEKGDILTITDEEKINFVDRYLIYDKTNHFNMEVLKYLIYSVRYYSWDECYQSAMSDEEAIEKLNDLVPICETDIYLDSLYEDFYHFVRYSPTKAFKTYLKTIATKFNIHHDLLIGREMDMRLRRHKFLSPEHSIRTPYGKDYLFIHYFNKERNACEGGLICIGFACIVCFREQGIFFCSRCQEAVYCCKEHQQKDWPNHKSNCIKK
jgi:hypothetical protein